MVAVFACDADVAERASGTADTVPAKALSCIALGGAAWLLPAAGLPELVISVGAWAATGLAREVEPAAGVLLVFCVWVVSISETPNEIHTVSTNTSKVRHITYLKTEIDSDYRSDGPAGD